MSRIKIIAFMAGIIMVELFIIQTAFAQWIKQTSSVTSTLNKVYFANDQKGWIVGRDGIILHTLDGGNNWTIQISNTSYDLNNLFFTSSETGWVVGGGPNNVFGNLLHTTNSGADWSIEIEDSSYFSGVHFTSMFNGWILPRWSGEHSRSDWIELMERQFFPGYSKERKR